MIMMMWCNEVKDENKISNQERGGRGRGHAFLINCVRTKPVKRDPHLTWSSLKRHGKWATAVILLARSAHCQDFLFVFFWEFSNFFFFFFYRRNFQFWCYEFWCPYKYLFRSDHLQKPHTTDQGSRIVDMTWLISNLKMRKQKTKFDLPHWSLMMIFFFFW